MDYLGVPSSSTTSLPTWDPVSPQCSVETAALFTIFIKSPPPLAQI